MYRTKQTSAERCAEHDLAVGPAGACVLCRRAPTRAGALSRWLSPALLAAALGSTLLGGVALARTRAPAAPVGQFTVAADEVRPSLHGSIEAPRTELPAAVRETRPCEPEVVLPVVAAPASQQRNYLDEAYAAMPKGNPYEEGSPSHATPGRAPCPCAKAGCRPRTYLSSRPLAGYPSGRVGVPTTRLVVAEGHPLSGPVPSPPSHGGGYRR